MVRWLASIPIFDDKRKSITITPSSMVQFKTCVVFVQLGSTCSLIIIFILIAFY